MVEKNLSELSLENLIKKRDLLKGVCIGFGTIFILTIVLITYFFSTKGLKEIPFAALIPVLALPVTFTPLIANFKLLNQEIKTRNTQ